jgi:hypothetical protein
LKLETLIAASLLLGSVALLLGILMHVRWLTITGVVLAGLPVLFLLFAIVFLIIHDRVRRQH